MLKISRAAPAAAAAFPLLPVLAAVVAVAMAGIASDGGHLSLDSVKQMVEGATGRSASWSPPFMSAVLSELGGTPFQPRVAAMGFVALVGLLTWGGLLLAASHPVTPRFALPRGLLVAVLLLNPVLVAYSGIVWKDVLFAALSAAALGAALRSLAEASVARRLAWGLVAAACSAVLPEVRQHGVFILPCVVAMVLAGIAWLPGWSRGGRVVVMAGFVLSTLGMNLAAGWWAGARIANGDADSTSVGFRSIAAFDLLGIEQRIDVGPLRAAGFSGHADAILAKAYTPDRIDFVDTTPDLAAYFNTRTTESLVADWRAAIVQYPEAYASHRLALSQRLLGVGGACLPVHVGVSGLQPEIDALGYVAEIDRSDATVFGLLQPLTSGPLFFHGSYLVLLGAILVVVPFTGRRSRLVLASACLAPLAYYGSFVVTGIACDFRYLYPALLMVSLLAVAIVSGWREASDVEDGAWR